METLDGAHVDENVFREEEGEDAWNQGNDQIDDDALLMNAESPSALYPDRRESQSLFLFRKDEDEALEGEEGDDDEAAAEETEQNIAARERERLANQQKYVWLDCASGCVAFG